VINKTDYGFAARKDRQHVAILRHNKRTCAERGHVGSDKILDGNVVRCTRCGEACGFVRLPVARSQDNP